MSENSNINNWYGMSEHAIISELASFVKETRLKKNYTQSELAEKAGVHRITLSEFEQGKRGSLTTFIQILRALGELELLDVFKIRTSVSPLIMARLEAKKRKRASKTRSKESSKKSKKI
ncbi:MAG: helix-turn-helix transcriptional regulator [Bacteroidetes bacterium]|nr:helix-turn-helix transcriptional regulator [Bacteroidota bacterium]